jgi:hypothetical protein
MRTGPRTEHTATLLPSGKVLVAGGEITFKFVSPSAELYDPQTDTWSAAEMMARGRSGHTATLLSSGKVLVVGGIQDGPAATGAELYDPVSNTWALTSPMTAAGRVAAQVVPAGKGADCRRKR